MKKYSKKFLSVIALVLITGGVLYFSKQAKKEITSFKSDVVTNKEAPKHSFKKAKADQVSHSSPVKKNGLRAPAAIRPKKTYVHIKTTNRFDSNWEKKAYENISRNLSKDYKVSLTHRGQSILRHGPEKKLVEKSFSDGRA
jgi:hypothetical protein